MTKNDFDLIVFCHLRWEFVTQRPQHIMNRLARDHKILFVEESIGYNKSNKGSANIFSASKNITVLQPRISPENYAKELIPILRQQIDEAGFRRNPVLWFYSGYFYDILDYLEDYQLIVYDCMDELSAFLGAPTDLIENEKKLLKSADIVFTGGRSLYESKSRLHDNVFCFPSSVDRKHFEAAIEESTKIALDIAKIKKPIVGYYGVIDERIDTDLLKKAAHALPDVSFVMIGPVVKISPSDLPQGENIHFLGSKSYDDLPSYLKAFDIAMMPFALNDSTKFISPTKTLEFMAAKKPIVSTPIFDVVRTFKDEVKISHTPQEFTAAIKDYLSENKKAREQRENFQEHFLQQTSWDKTVAGMTAIIISRLKKLNKTKTTATLQSLKART